MLDIDNNRGDGGTAFMSLGDGGSDGISFGDETGFKSPMRPISNPSFAFPQLTIGGGGAG
jgi:hypothetical protein